MSLRWDETMLLGIDEIDDQHKTIIEKFTPYRKKFKLVTEWYNSRE